MRYVHCSLGLTETVYGWANHCRVSAADHDAAEAGEEEDKENKAEAVEVNHLNSKSPFLHLDRILAGYSIYSSLLI